MSMELADVARLGNRVLDEVEKAVIGKREALELLLLGVLADGHILIEDYPGLAKTLMARSFAATLSLDFSRIQFTPDLMPSDVTGSSVYNQREADFVLQAADLLREGRLGHVLALCGAGEVQLLGEGHQVAQLAQFHKPRL